jgi:hypothetical protein
MLGTSVGGMLVMHFLQLLTPVRLVISTAAKDALADLQPV